MKISKKKFSPHSKYKQNGFFCVISPLFMKINSHYFRSYEWVTTVEAVAVTDHLHPHLEVNRFVYFTFAYIRIVKSISGSYGDHRNSNGHSRDRQGGNNLLDDLDSFTVAPLRPGPPIIKNFYVESPIISSRPQVNQSTKSCCCFCSPTSFHFSM